MKSNSLKEIAKAVSALKPVERPSAADWRRVERELGTQLPDDYKELVSIVGSGYFGAGISLKNPVSTSPLNRLSKELLENYRESMTFLEDELGIKFHPEEDGLLWFGGFGRVHFFWRPPCTPNSSEFVLIDGDIDELHEIPFRISEYIWSLYMGRLEDDWSKEFRGSIWGPSTPFFECHPGFGG